MKLTEEQSRRLELLNSLKERSVITIEELRELNILSAMEKDNSDQEEETMGEFCRKNHKVLTELAEQGKFKEYDTIVFKKLDKFKTKYKNLFNTMGVDYMQPFFELKNLRNINDTLIKNCSRKKENKFITSLIEAATEFDTCNSKEQYAVREYCLIEESHLVEKLIESCNAYPFPIALRTVETIALAKLPIIIENIYDELGMDSNQKTPDVAVLKLALGVVQKASKRALTSIVDIHEYAEEVHKYADLDSTAAYLGYVLTK